jgi:hypothetical protein
MEPMQINAIDFERSEKALRAFFRDNSKKLPDGINININHKSANGKIAIVVWSYQSDSDHIEGAARKIEKDFKLSSFGPVEKNGRGATYYSSSKEMSIEDFAGLLKAINPKDSEKLVESVKKDYEALEIKRKKEQAKIDEQSNKAVRPEVLTKLKKAFVEAEKKMLSLYPGNTSFRSKACQHFDSAIDALKPGADLGPILARTKMAVAAFDEEMKGNVNKDEVAKAKMKLVSLQAMLEDAIKTPVEGKGPPPKSSDPGKQPQPCRP